MHYLIIAHGLTHEIHQKEIVRFTVINENELGEYASMENMSQLQK